MKILTEEIKSIVCPYCSKLLEFHPVEFAGIDDKYSLFICDRMPRDGRIWCIPELHISINHPSYVKRT